MDMDCFKDDFPEDSMDITTHFKWTKDEYYKAGWESDDVNPSHDSSNIPWNDIPRLGSETEMVY